MNTPKPKQPKVKKPSPALSLKTGIKAGATWAGN
jgi:hypothetical protein